MNQKFVNENEIEIEKNEHKKNDEIVA